VRPAHIGGDLCLPGSSQSYSFTEVEWQKQWDIRFSFLGRCDAALLLVVRSVVPNLDGKTDSLLALHRTWDSYPVRGLGAGRRIAIAC